MELVGTSIFAVLTICLTFTCANGLEEAQFVVAGRGVNYNTALYLCNGQGMKLIRIDNDETNSLVYNFSVKNQLGRYWVDANDNQVEGQWVYTDGSAATYINFQKPEPNGGRNQNCAQGGYLQQGFWWDIHCTDGAAVICYSDDPANSAAKSLHEYQIRYVATNMNYHEAANACKAKGLKLLKIPNEESNKIALKISLAMQTSYYWIDGNDIEKEGTFVDTDGNNLKYFNFYVNQPDNAGNNENCLLSMTNYEGKWIDTNCNNKYAVLCYTETEVETSPSIRLPQLDIAALNVDHHTALNVCKSKGMRLVRMNNEATNQLVFRFADAMNVGYYWIDANDIQTEGKFVYDDGEPVTFSLFHPLQPDNIGKNEHCVMGKYYNLGYWNDFPCSNKLAAICYSGDIVGPRKALKSILVHEDKVDYENALKACRSKKLNLLSITDSETNTAVYEYALKTGSIPYWIDANDNTEEGTWVNSFNQKLRYSNFNAGEPSIDTNKNCIQGTTNGKWKNVPCTKKKWVLCYSDE